MVEWVEMRSMVVMVLRLGRMDLWVEARSVVMMVHLRK